ncbi:uncharacterized protein LOC123260403 [Cotesia glomerata]|uniref:Ropporin-1-like protein n=1 Tax=Cotesia glomerata TaxID=32391 RepID=A0AAV7HZ11_COTGL|nr:uncharacterized protein LOC123260403 [Cotesia glomerata]KAH0550459.1 hypothetical protein KQX54_019509 [Cotesia glomerata]
MINEERGTSSISVPPKLPVILKQFCKAAIRTQPYDLLKWSTAYFNALAEGSEPPSKTRLEYPLETAASGSCLTFGLLKVLVRQLGDYNKTVPVEVILKRWTDLCLEITDLNLIMIVGKFRRKCQIKKFLAIAAGLLGSSLFDTMLIICELFTMEPDGGSSMIPVNLFMEIYEYLAGLNCGGEEREPNQDLSEFVIFESSECQSTSELKSDEVNSTQDSTKHPSVEGSEATEEQPVFEKQFSNNYNQLSRDSEEIIDVLDKDHKTQSEEKKILSVNVDNLLTSNADGHQNVKSAKMTKDSDNRSLASDDSIGLEKTKSARIKNKCKINSNWISHYPMIPGIGPKLSSSEVTRVGKWMAECSTVQGGMVGPRNLRHFQCPPLDHQKI